MDEQRVELRGPCSKWIVDVLDAVTFARKMDSRTGLVNEILGAWARERLHEATLIHNVTRGTPVPSVVPGSDGRAPEVRQAFDIAIEELLRVRGGSK